jgi:hypothetical protein
MKPDLEQFRKFLADLAEADWIKRTERRWWPSFVFHYTDVRNAAVILQDNCLYSRGYLESTKALPVSSGSDLVLAGTDPQIKECVRLYFRPQTPTQYHVEGVRSQKVLASSRFPDAHCPTPIFFLFDAVDVLTLDHCKFSDKGLGSHGYRLFSSANELRQLNWQKIYHTGPIDRNRPEESDIIARRQAEVIVPQKLDLESLRFIYCRSEAERETLLYLLPAKVRLRYQRKIIATTRSNLFFRQHTYLENVRLNSQAATLQFSPETHSKGPFHLRIEISDEGVYRVVEDKEFTFDRGYKWQLAVPSPVYKIQVYLDSHLLYANMHEEMDIPF